MIKGLAGADAPARLVLLHALARAGGTEALQATVGRLKDDDPAVRDEAVRMLSTWAESTAVPSLLTLARSDDKLSHRVLAVRGLVRHAVPQAGKPADLKLLTELLTLAPGPEEKRLVLAALGETGRVEALAVLAPALDDPALADDAGLAAVKIAEKLKSGERDQVRQVLEKVKKKVNDQTIRERSRKGVGRSLRLRLNSRVKKT